MFPLEYQPSRQLDPPVYYQCAHARNILDYWFGNGLNFHKWFHSSKKYDKEIKELFLDILLIVTVSIGALLCMFSSSLKILVFLASCVAKKIELSRFEPIKASLHEAFVAMVGTDKLTDADFSS